MRHAGAGLVVAVVALAAGAAPREGPERRAVEFLAREVPAWSRENHCFSCHNNGDAARALFATRGRSYAVADAPVADTLGWLARPSAWDANAADPAVSDKVLARIQFAAALELAVDREWTRDRGALAEAAGRVAADQAAGGFWPVGAEGSLGTPATYGRPLATAIARRTLAAAGGTRFAAPVARAEGWLRGRPVENTLDASAALIGLSADAPANRGARRVAADWLICAQGEQGGWGPFLRSPPEPFDTAVALIALSRTPDAGATRARVARGRAFLIATQNEDGSWTETTRPPGATSYAQRLSTTGWATLALLATADP